MTAPPALDTRAMRRAASIPLDHSIVESHLLPDRPGDQLFAHAWKEGLASLPLAERRGALAVATGQIAESVAETLLVDAGFTPLWHIVGGGVGVDLLMVDAEFSFVLAVEVKGTFQAGRWPHLTRGRLHQMTPQWLDRPGNSGMEDIELAAADVYGAVFLLNFADMAARVGVTSDFVRVEPVTSVGGLASLPTLAILP